MTPTRQVIAAEDDFELDRAKRDFEALLPCAGGYVEGDAITGGITGAIGVTPDFVTERLFGRTFVVVIADRRIAGFMAECG